MSSIKYKGLGLLLVLLVACLLPMHAVEKAEKESFNAGKFILGHITDSYSWHVTKVGEKEVSIPLPVIVKSKDRGWFVFLSSKFEHGHASYQGFQLSKSETNKGKIVELLPNKTEVRPTDLSITKNVTSLLISAFLLLWIFLSLARHYKKGPKVAPKGFNGAMEFLVVFIHDQVIRPCVGKDYKRYSPYLLTIFFFILINNTMGLIPIFPGGANLTGNLACTGVLALCTFVVVNVFGNKHYWMDILWPDVPTFLKAPLPIMPFLELFGIFSKPMALMIRLFANMLAGHMIAMVFMSLIFIFGSISVAAGSGVSVLAVLFAIIMNILELLVVFIQAYVFTLLSSVFIGLSRLEPAKEH